MRQVTVLALGSEWWAPGQAALDPENQPKEWSHKLLLGHDD
jgi:hypothetical protein